MIDLHYLFDQVRAIQVYKIFSSFIVVMASNNEMNLSDHYVDLLERAIEENRQLREEIKRQNNSNQKIFEDFTSRLNEMSRESNDGSSRRRRNNNQKIVVPQVCRHAFRTIYKKMKKGSDFEGFAMSESYSDKANQDVVLKVTQAVFEDNGGQDKCPWSNAQLQAAGATYFKTRKDAHAREQKDATNKHNLTCRRQGRIRDKVQKRLDTLEKMTCGSERRAEIQAVLIPSYTSSDESDFSEDENGDPSRLKGYLVKKLPWERASLRKVKAKLDNKYLESLSARSRRNILPRRNHSTPSVRPVPPNAPQWAVRPLTNTPVATSTPIRSR